MTQTPENSKLSKNLFKKRVIDFSHAIKVVLTAIPKGWEVKEGRAIKIEE